MSPSPASRWVLPCALLCAAAAWGQAPTRRFAIFVGNNEGGADTQALLYAKADAKRLHDVFTRLGGVRPEDTLLLLDEPAAALEGALVDLERRARAARDDGGRTALLFYYSGHAKDGALRLGSSSLAMDALKARFGASAFDTRVAIFDACRSGAVTRTKGVRRAPAFEIDTGGAALASGLVILTSSASDEDSQESDLIGASYFSYHLATGLLGSADQSGDGKVTLAEAYAYAYERTVASTAESAAGTQHPTFAFDLKGNGDLTLTDVAQRSEGLRLPAAAPRGTYFLIDPQGVVVAELTKADIDRLIALRPNTYTVKRRLADRLRVGSVTIAAGQVHTLDEASLRDAKLSDDPVKGTSLRASFSRHVSLAATGQFQAVFDRPTAQGGYFPSAPLIGADLTFHNLIAKSVSLGVDGAFGWADGRVSSGLVQNAAYRYSLITFGVTGLYEFGPERAWIPFLGVRVGYNVMRREFPELAVPAQTFSVMSPGLVGGVKWRFARNFALLARGRVHYLLYNVDETKSLGYAELGLLLQYEIRD